MVQTHMGTEHGTHKTGHPNQNVWLPNEIHSDKCLDYESAVQAEAPQNVVLPKAHVILVI
jgi:hypothetical protein